MFENGTGLSQGNFLFENVELAQLRRKQKLNRITRTIRKSDFRIELTADFIIGRLKIINLNFVCFKTGTCLHEMDFTVFQKKY